jgi:hypothetical protein
MSACAYRDQTCPALEPSHNLSSGMMTEAQAGTLSCTPEHMRMRHKSRTVCADMFRQRGKHWQTDDKKRCAVSHWHSQPQHNTRAAQYPAALLQTQRAPNNQPHNLSLPQWHFVHRTGVLLLMHSPDSY